MKNLKRVLSLGLASVMLLGMMVMGASAATFTDEDQIVNKDAVTTMVALNVIAGKDTGAFDPNGTVTRGEMAKMITMILFGGEEPVLTTGSNPKFTDVTNHWARKYIEYCASSQLKVIAGNGDGTFAPDAPVTGTAAAKMALVALGYDAAVYNFENHRDWDLNINTVANRPENNLYKGLKGIDPSKAITRDQAAQILYNALNAYVVEPRYTVTNNGTEITYVPSTTTTLMKKQFDVVTKYAYLTDVAYSTEKKVNQYTFADASFGGSAITTDLLSAGTYDFDGDVSELFGQRVKVVYKTGATDAVVDTILGIYAAEDSKVLATVTVGDIADADIQSGDTEAKIAGTTYKFDGVSATPATATAQDVAIYSFLTPTAISGKNLTALSGVQVEAEAALIDNDGNGKVDCVVVYPFTVAKVTYVGSKSFTAGTTKKFEDVNVYEGVKKDDLVKIVATANTVDGKEAITKLDTIKDVTVDATRKNAADVANAEFRVDGTWYKFAAAGQIGTAVSTTTAGTDVTEMLIINGYAFMFDTTAAAGDKNYALVTGVVIKDGNGWKGNEAKLLFPDGTEEIVEIDKAYTAAEAAKDTGKTALTDAQLKTTLEGKLVTYSVSKDKYTLNVAVAKTDVGSGVDADKVKDNTGFDSVTDAGDKFVAASGSNAATLDGNAIADDAIVFVKTTKDGVDTYSVITGKELAEKGSATVENGFATQNSGTKYSTVALAYVSGVSTKSSEDKWGYVVSDIITVKKGNDRVASFTLFNGEEEIAVTSKASASTLTNLAKGTVIKYTIDADNVVDVDNDEIIVIADDTVTLDSVVGAIVAYDGSKMDVAVTSADEDVNGDGTEEKVITSDASNEAGIKIDKDTVILTIDTASTEGIVGGQIGIATATETTDNYIANVILIKGTDDRSDKADVIIFCADLLNVLG